MSVPNTFASATAPIPLANLDANFAYYDGAFDITGTVMRVNYTFQISDQTDATKIAQFQLSGIPTATTRIYTLPNLTGTLATIGNLSQTFSGATTFSSTFTLSGTTAAINLGTSSTSGAQTIGGTSGTGIITLGRSTVSQTTNIQAGATASGSTKTINVGTAGLSGSTTTITYGSSVSGATVSHTFNANGDAAMGVDSAGRSIAYQGTANVPTVSTVASGSTIALTNATSHLLYNNAATAAALTVTLPSASLQDGQMVTIATQSAITALTVNGGTIYGAPTTLAAGGFATLIYSSTATAWFRKG